MNKGIRFNKISIFGQHCTGQWPIQCWFISSMILIIFHFRLTITHFIFYTFGLVSKEESEENPVSRINTQLIAYMFLKYPKNFTLQLYVILQEFTREIWYFFQK